MKTKENLERRTLDVQVAELLRDRIVMGQFAAGERLTESQIAEEFELSRGTIRAALRKLVSEGLIVQLPYRGWEVSDFAIKDAYELQTLRSSLEGLASRLAAENINSSGFQILEAAFAGLKKSALGLDVRDAALADFALHRTIVELSGHSRLIETYNMIATQVKRYIFSSDSLTTGGQELIDQHAPIVDAILIKDGAAAAQLASAHNDKEGDRLIRHLKEIQDAQHSEPDPKRVE